ncbi:MAG: hypothetical protein US86_C0002G0076 [Candidatus Daviesbacteria bacterium GW2011_GWA2_38_24]|uniref:Uncharacterized protein n=1 Tax=Candidatus Daviesbacteria bacterium GW2011_GWA2_38_24 TaxID=1618422 RepID=A0A0G0LZX1_9BACT|nr:MAG: hypothetical protein US86_C0002G0076 [Candidatus Daviesbacteria bacterium GW2011_GWA2_38_24]KKQ79817.1 MAG: hypothetical protein UT01_C0027G0002 [Candidatus Daviesbacteria bacterium GW2011_GWA1_38_7]
MNSIQQRLTSVGNIDKQKVARVLAEEGQHENSKMHNEITALIEKNPDYNPFVLAVIQSLLWAHYAKNDDKFITLVLDYFNYQKDELLDNLNKFTLLYDEDSLRKTLKSWKILLDKLLPQLKDNYSPEGLISLQQKLINEAVNLSYSKQISNLGAWFCCAPFMALAVWKKEYWDDEQLDSLTLPLGIQVTRAIDWLNRNGSDFAYTIKTVDEVNLADGLASTIEAMGAQKELAQLAKTRALHINTGLWLLGNKKEIS